MIEKGYAVQPAVEQPVPSQNTIITNIDAIAPGIGMAVVPKSGRDITDFYHVTKVVSQSFAFIELPSRKADGQFVKR